jgi:hypothetical protein
VIIFTLASVVVEVLAILQTNLRPMLPPGGRKWQQIYPNFFQIEGRLADMVTIL